jgi:hypothetical protein
MLNRGGNERSMLASLSLNIALACHLLQSHQADHLRFSYGFSRNCKIFELHKICHILSSIVAGNFDNACMQRAHALKQERWCRFVSRNQKYGRDIPDLVTYIELCGTLFCQPCMNPLTPIFSVSSVAIVFPASRVSYVPISIQ